MQLASIALTAEELRALLLTCRVERPRVGSALSDVAYKAERAARELGLTTPEALERWLYAPRGEG